MVLWSFSHGQSSTSSKLEVCSTRGLCTVQYSTVQCIVDSVTDTVTLTQYNDRVSRPAGLIILTRSKKIQKTARTRAEHI